MILYKCPKCGSEVNTFSKMSNPPIHCYHCTKCDYAHEEREPNIEIVAPIVQQQLYDANDQSDKADCV